MVANVAGQAPGTAAPPLVGREREQTMLRAALAAALSGQSSLALIGGEAGIGKTALAEWLCAEATALGALVLVGRGYDLSETPPYGPWAEAFAPAPRGDALPALPAALRSPEHDDGAAPIGRDAIVRRVRDYLAALAATRPVVLLLEDLHWADPASLDLLRVVGRGLATLPVLILATYRADEVAHDHPLTALVPLLVREARAARLDLRPLDGADIGALVAGRYALADADRGRLVGYLAGRTEGNALFLGELLRTLEAEGLLRPGTRPATRLGGFPAGAPAGGGEQWALGELGQVPVPPLLRQVIAGRLARLPPETRRLLAVAAVVGQVVPLTLWATVGEAAEGALLDHAERAVAARFLVETPDGAGVRFAHALIREALYAGTPTPRRRALHRQVGEALAATPAGNPPERVWYPAADSDAVAYHFQQAGDPRAVEWLVRAGLRARASAASITAAARFAAAAALLAGDATHVGERGWLLLLAGGALIFADTNAALHHLDEAESVARLTGDLALAAYLRSIRSLVLCHRPRDVRAGVEEMERGVAAVEALPPEYRRWSADQVALARLGALLPAGELAPLPAPARPLPAALRQRGNLANQYGFVGRYREALALGEATVGACLDDDQAERDALGRFGLAHAYGALGRPTEARREYALWNAYLYARNELYVVEYCIWTELRHAVLPCQADDIAERARLVAESARAWATVQDTVIAAPYPSQANLPVALVEGRWTEARRLAEAAVAVATIGHAQAAGAALGELARHQGDPDAAWARVRALHPAGPDTAPGDCHFLPGLDLLAVAAELELDAGDLALAEEWVAAHGRWLDWSGAVLWQAEHLLLRARLAWVSGDPANARAHAEAALARATEPRQPLALLAAHRTLGKLDTASRRYTEAAVQLDAALALADACAAPYERALALLTLAELRIVEGRRDEATAPLAEAHAICTRLSARPTLARIAAVQAHLAATLAASSRPDGLSRREAEVLRLLATGRSNGQVAQALFVSPRTVKRHIANAYHKIGAHNRAEATAYALHHGLA